MYHLKNIFLLNRLLSVPFWVILNIFPLILYKELAFTPWQITAVIIIKPASALLASYWGAFIHERGDLLKKNLLWGSFLRYLPFLFFPCLSQTSIYSSWFLVFSFGYFMVLNRGVMPAWMEIFKKHLPEETQAKVFAFGASIDYLGSALLPLAIGFILDDYKASWRYLFLSSALLGLFSTFFLNQLPTSVLTGKKKEASQALTYKQQIIKPWQQAYTLLKVRSDFAKYQWGFMLGGAGLIIIQPMIPLYFVDILDLSYLEMLFAISVCKSLGFALASPYWTKRFKNSSIYLFSSRVVFLAGLFPLIFMLAKGKIVAIYLAYLLYGIMQAGSELSWHLSGPIFAKEQDSAIYSVTNLLSVGLRGCIFPLLGSLCYSFTNVSTVLILGALLCFFSSYQLLSYSRQLVPLKI